MPVTYKNLLHLLMDRDIATSELAAFVQLC